MEAKSIIFLIITLAAFFFLAKNLVRMFSYLKVGKSDDRSSNFGARFSHTLAVAFGQTKIMREKLAGALHVGIFWGFLVLLFSASESVIQGFYSGFTWNILGPVYTAITFLTDVFCAAIIIAVIVSFFRRFVFKVKRLQGDADEKIDAAIVLGSIFVIVSSLLIECSAATALGKTGEWAYKPVSSLISEMISTNSAPLVYEICWWIHILAIYFFMNYLPYSKHFHVYTSIQNVFFSPVNIPNRLSTIDFEDETIEKFGASDIDDLSWKSLHDGYSCTHCGRCESVCPAAQTGKELSPREIIVQIRKRTIECAPVMLRQKEAGEEAELSENDAAMLEKKFVGEYESVDALWQCTTCGACMQECPIAIEHVPPIIEMRRSLVMMEADFPQLLQSAFSNLETNSTPWAFSPEQRGEWAESAGVQTAADNPDFDVLFWVGCAGSFDDRAKEISIAFAKLLQKAGVNFAILGSEENCNGDVARRAGNEYLADMLVKMNIETLNAYNVKKIVTACPHCFNTLKNEYPDFGGNYEVVHHTEFLLELIKSGKLKLKAGGEAAGEIAYHDSCYLGRYNQIYDAPRELLRQVPGLKIAEPGRTKSRGFCCGAGGAQMFMEETEGKRVNVERTEELLATGAKTLAANCPFCMTMLGDGIKAKDKEESVKALDVAEILLKYAE